MELDRKVLEALRKGRQLRVIGFDDAPFSKQKDRTTSIAGIVCSNTRFEGMLWGEVTTDGLDATEVVTSIVQRSKFYSQLHVVLLDGIAFGGFNMVDLPRLATQLELPCIAVMRKTPDLRAIDAALTHFGDYEQRRTLLELAGSISERDGFVFQTSGLAPDSAAMILGQITDTGKVPEALRLAHLIGAAVKTGESGSRA